MDKTPKIITEDTKNAEAFKNEANDFFKSKFYSSFFLCQI